MDTLSPQIIAVGSSVFALLLVLMMPKITGWDSLSERFPANSDFKGKWLDFQSLQLGIGRFRGCTSLGFSNDFLFIKMSIFLFNGFFKPIRIPWSAVQAISARRVLWATYYEIAIDDAPKLTIKASKSVTEVISGNKLLKVEMS